MSRWAELGMELLSGSSRSLTDNPVLESMILSACDPHRFDPDLALNLEICELVNQKGKGWPRDAAIIIVKLINSRSPQTTSLALTLLDNCVKNCGYPFHLQVATKEFLNELVRRFPERPPPFNTPAQHRILSFIQEWNATLLEGRYKFDLRHIGEMYALLQYKGYRFPGLGKDVSVLKEGEVLKSEQELETEDRRAQEAKLHELLRRQTPQALAQANELMKTLAGYDLESRPDYRGQVLAELNKIATRAKSLNAVLDALPSNPSKPWRPDSKQEDAYSQCKGAQGRIRKWLEDGGEESDEADKTERLLALNDLLNEVIERYDAARAGKAVPPSSEAITAAVGATTDEPKTPPSGGTSPSDPKGKKEKPAPSQPPPALIELGFGESSAGNSGGTASSADGKPEPVNLIDDLSGLSFADPARPWGLGGSISLGVTAPSPQSSVHDLLSNAGSSGVSVTPQRPQAPLATPTPPLAGGSALPLAALPPQVLAMAPVGVAPILPTATPPGPKTTSAAGVPVVPVSVGGQASLNAIAKTGAPKQAEVDLFGVFGGPAPSPSPSIPTISAPPSAASPAPPPALPVAPHSPPKTSTPVPAVSSAPAVPPVQNSARSESPSLDWEFQTAPLKEEAGVAAHEVTVFDKNGLRMTLRRVSREGAAASYLASFWNAIPVEMNSLVFQAAVPRSMTLKLDPISGQVIPAVNKTPVTQTFKVVNPGGEPERLRFRISYAINNVPITEIAEFSDFGSL